jgi:hypothetical protein
MFDRQTLPAAKTLATAGLCLTLALGALGGTAAPARADGQDVARILGGLVALYVIGRAIDEANARNDPPRHAPPPQAHRPPRPQPMVAPARCFIEGHDRNGYFRGYVRRCMQNNVAQPARLPDQCLRRVTTQRGDRLIYGGRCLARNGWVRG